MQLIPAWGDTSCGASQDRLLYLRGDFVDMAELTEENLGAGIESYPVTTSHL